MQKHTTLEGTEYTNVWLARIFPNLWLLGDNAEKPQNKRRRKGKNTGTPNPGVEVVASKLLPNYIEFMPGYLGAFTLKNTGSDFQPRLPFLSLPIHLRHKHIYSFKQHLFVFKNQTLQGLYTLLHQEGLDVTSDIWH